MLITVYLKENSLIFVDFVINSYPKIILLKLLILDVFSFINANSTNFVILHKNAMVSLRQKKNIRLVIKKNNIKGMQLV